MKQGWVFAVALAGAVALGSLQSVTPANAQDRWYASIGGHYVLPWKSKLSSSGGTGNTAFTASAEGEMGGSVGVTAAVGYGAASGMRGEIELGWRRSGLSKLKNFRGTLGDGAFNFTVPAKGSVSTLSLMANGYFATDVWQVRPYAGFGLGMARHSVKLDSVTFSLDDNDVTVPLNLSESKYVFAYQAMVGVSIPLSDALDGRLGYRYFATTAANFSGTKATYGTHNVEAGVLFRF